MSGIHIDATPGYFGWTKLARERTWKTMDPKEIEEMAVAVNADWVACGHPGGKSMPNHNTGHVSYNPDGSYHSAYSYQCRSGSRWFNPATRQMEGRGHCTCDGCF